MFGCTFDVWDAIFSVQRTTLLVQDAALNVQDEMDRATPSFVTMAPTSHATFLLLLSLLPFFLILACSCPNTTNSTGFSRRTSKAKRWPTPRVQLLISARYTKASGIGVIRVSMKLEGRMLKPCVSSSWIALTTSPQWPNITFPISSS